MLIYKIAIIFWQRVPNKFSEFIAY